MNNNQLKQKIHAAYLDWYKREDNPLLAMPETGHPLPITFEAGYLAALSAPDQPQEQPVAVLHDDGYWTWIGTPPHKSDCAGWRMEVYAAPVQPASQESAVIKDSLTAIDTGDIQQELIRKEIRDWENRFINADTALRNIECLLDSETVQPADPMDWPLPCDITVGAGTIKAGVKLRTLVARMGVLHSMAKDVQPASKPEADLQAIEDYFSHTSLLLLSECQSFVDWFDNQAGSSVSEWDLTRYKYAKARLALTRCNTSSTPADDCRNCKGTGIDVDCGPDGAAVNCMCGCCKGTGREASEAAQEPTVEMIRAGYAYIDQHTKENSHDWGSFTPKGLYVAMQLAGEAAQPAPEAGTAGGHDDEQYQKLRKLAYRTIWIAYVWNDHNFDAAHLEARRTCERIGLKSFDEAGAFLDATEAASAPAQAVTLTDADILDTAHRMAWRYKHSSDPHHSHTYAFTNRTMVEFVRRLLGSAKTGEANG